MPPKLNIRASYDPETKKTKYYFGFTELWFCGYSFIDDNGVFQKSPTLVNFIKKQGL